MNYQGVIIAESLEDQSVLKMVNIVKTKVEQVTSHHKTPWITTWTLHTIEIPEENADMVAKTISKSLDSDHSWYADFKNEKYHYIMYTNKVFKVDLKNPSLYREAKKYGISIGIPEYQLDFAPKDQIWKR